MGGMCGAWGLAASLPRPHPTWPSQICVEKCPDRYLTFLSVYKTRDLDPRAFAYYKQFCGPGFQESKVSGKLPQGLRGG